MIWKKVPIKTDNGEEVLAQAPVIISASRSTDIPTFYGDWFIERWKKGYVKWINPFNGKPSYVSFEKTRAIIFWSKNPKPFMKHLDFLDAQKINYYFQFSLNDYDKEGFEGKVPKVSSRIESFKELSNRIGKERVIWRFDPMILTNEITVEELLIRIKKIGNELKEYTNKLVFSFADISIYRKVQNNLKKEGVDYIDFTTDLMHEFAKGLQKLNKELGLTIATCAEKIPLQKYNIEHNKCIDDDLLIQEFSNDVDLMDFLGVKVSPPSLFSPNKTIQKTKILKDKGQREACGCIMSKDIGQYNTCPHECNYCYANASKEAAKRNFKEHKLCPESDSIL